MSLGKTPLVGLILVSCCWCSHCEFGQTLLVKLWWLWFYGCSHCESGQTLLVGLGCVWCYGFSHGEFEQTLLVGLCWTWRCRSQCQLMQTPFVGLCWIWWWCCSHCELGQCLIYEVRNYWEFMKCCRTRWFVNSTSSHVVFFISHPLMGWWDCGDNYLLWVYDFVNEKHEEWGLV